MKTGNSPSGWVPATTPSSQGYTGGYIYMTNKFWTSSYADGYLQTAGIIAHEEGGHESGEDGPYHNTGMAEWYHATCGE